MGIGEAHLLDFSFRVLMQKLPNYLSTIDIHIVCVNLWCGGTPTSTTHRSFQTLSFIVHHSLKHHAIHIHTTINTTLLITLFITAINPIYVNTTRVNATRALYSQTWNTHLEPPSLQYEYS